MRTPHSSPAGRPGRRACAAAPAVAADHPAPGKPGAGQKKPKGPFKTLRVCKKGCRFKTIQAAVNKAKAGDTVRFGTAPTVSR